MLNNCIKIFKRQPDMEKFVLDTYVPADGDYIVMKYQDEKFIEKLHIKVKQDKKTRTLNLSPLEKYKISQLDYYSKLVEMNKPIDPKKVIHSNNYLSFWIKKDNLTSGKLTKDIIDRYYEVLENPYTKYTKKHDQELYESVEKELGPVNRERLALVKTWVKENIFNLPYEIEGKDYLKIFFEFEDIDIKAEGKRYFIPNLFNKNDFNTKVNGEIYGLPNNNMQMNSKKPYLEYKNRVTKVPLLQTSEHVLEQKLFFDYLQNCASGGLYNIYFIKEMEEQDDYQIRPLTNKELPKIKSGYGYYLRVYKEKNEACIQEMDQLTNYCSKLEKPINVRNITEVGTELLKSPVYGQIKDLKELSGRINDVMFSNFLTNNYFTEPGNITGIEPKLKRNLVLSRTAFFNWFYKDDSSSVKAIWDKISLNIIKCSMELGYIIKANHQFNMRLAVLAYFKGGKTNMADVMIQVRSNLRDKINAKEYQSIENDEEYYYAVGQLSSYLLSKNKSKKREHSLINGFLNAKTDNILKQKLTVLFKRYNYDIDANSKRFNNLYSMILSYQVGTPVKQDYLIAGYISGNLIYEKNKEEQ
ncbi:MAG: type I-B CRISPR-associated protein Cas8b/Csh1 [bacterium]|nr:type I-B CRISPR-associated protein Cas8b/Csh1 [bacterium]